MKTAIWIYRGIFLGIILCLWELIVRVGIVDNFFLASPIQIISALDAVAKREAIYQAFAITMSEIAVAYVIAVFSGLIAGTILGLNESVYKSANGIIMILYGVPKSTVLPLFILYFGIGLQSKIAYGAISGFFPILMNTIAGARSIEPSMLSMARSMGAPKSHMFAKIIFPSILPHAFTGMRLGMNHTLLGVFLAELFFSQKGIGYHINMLTSTFKTDELFAIIGIVAAIAIVVNETLRGLENHFSRWREL